MTVIYTVTDSAGKVHTRKSAGHSKQVYTYAMIGNPGKSGKSGVNYASTYQGAANNMKYGGPNAEILPVTAVVK